ncbi:MAG TPA: copper resistance protein CopC [Chloroflexota bacterium]|nr:copper resistance protein CopC [Chloroflexota bacterium]
MPKAFLALALVLVALGGTGPAAPAAAHGQFQEATPSPGALLATPPSRVLLLFEDELDADGSTLQVRGPLGHRADRRDRQVEGARMWASLLDQGPGTYQVHWTAVAGEDKRRLRGTYAFTIQPQLPPHMPQLFVHPPMAHSGQQVTLAGSGFAPEADVVLSVGDDEQFLALARTDARGRFTAQATLPRTLPFGRQVLEAADAQDHFATAAVYVPRGGGPAAVPKLSGDAQLGEISYTLRVENHSGHMLRQLVIRADIPPDTQVLLEDLGQPAGVEPPTLEGGQLVWRARALPAHAILGPFTFKVSTLGLSGRPELTSTATVEYVVGSTPIGRETARAAEIQVRVVNR